MNSSCLVWRVAHRRHAARREPRQVHAEVGEAEEVAQRALVRGPRRAPRRAAG